MAYLGAVKQWDVIEADLDPTVGSEQKGNPRPVLVVSNDGFNARFSIVTVLPLTGHDGKTRSVYPFEVLLPADTAGNPKDSIIMPQQIRTIDKKRFLNAPLGSLTDPTLRTAVEDCMLQHLGIALDDDE